MIWARRSGRSSFSSTRSMPSTIRSTFAERKLRCAQKPADSRTSLTLTGLEQSADGFPNLGHDRMNDDDADEEADEHEFVGGGEGEHVGREFSLASHAKFGGLSYIDCGLFRAKRPNEQDARVDTLASRVEGLRRVFA